MRAAVTNERLAAANKVESNVSRFNGASLLRCGIAESMEYAVDCDDAQTLGYFGLQNSFKALRKHEGAVVIITVASARAGPTNFSGEYCVTAESSLDSSANAHGRI